MSLVCRNHDHARYMVPVLAVDLWYWAHDLRLQVESRHRRQHQKHNLCLKSNELFHVTSCYFLLFHMLFISMTFRSYALIHQETRHVRLNHRQPRVDGWQVRNEPAARPSSHSCHSYPPSWLVVEAPVTPS